MSPLLFNLYNNDLANYLKSLNIGVSFGNEKICILLYADDIVLLAETANDLQVLLDALHDWCCTNDMNTNSMKSNIVHFRPLSVLVTDVIFYFQIYFDKVSCQNLLYNFKKKIVLYM